MSPVIAGSAFHHWLTPPVPLLVLHEIISHRVTPGDGRSCSPSLPRPPPILPLPPAVAGASNKTLPFHTRYDPRVIASLQLLYVTVSVLFNLVMKPIKAKRFNVILLFQCRAFIIFFSVPISSSLVTALFCNNK